jgi:predicted ester cyclase
VRIGIDVTIGAVDRACQSQGRSQGHHRRAAIPSPGTIRGMTTTTNTNVDAALRSLELICSRDAGPAVDDVIHPDFVNHRPGAARGGPDGFRDVVRWLGAAFAEISIAPEDVIACGDRVVARARFKALHVGPFKGIPPTNRTIEFDQIHIWRMQNGLVAESWACMDEVSGLRQMGVALP